MDVGEAAGAPWLAAVLLYIFHARGLPGWHRLSLASREALEIACGSLLLMLGWPSVRAFLSHPARIAVLVEGPLPQIAAYRLTAGANRGVRSSAPPGALLVVLETMATLATLATFLMPAIDARGVLVLPGGDLCRYAGLIVLTAGTVLRITPMVQMRRSFALVVAVQEQHALHTSGLYRFIRHPSYSGYLLRYIGTVLVFRSGLGAAVFLGQVVFIYRRILAEERMLVENFGDRYRAYMARTKRLIPHVY